MGAMRFLDLVDVGGGRPDLGWSFGPVKAEVAVVVVVVPTGDFLLRVELYNIVWTSLY